MLLISYDISNTRLRSKLSKELQKHGRRIQYSVFEIDNSNIVLKNIKEVISQKYAKKLKKTDSIIIIPVNEVNKDSIIRYGQSVQELDRFLII
ncbi:CRISPR-associated endonuclease Cas2 [Candidatus Gracilibacteria bacterium]|nr:CRISPR-associated endonuclease Cas2 [Candidatus Gracilibacteria bacterium]